VKVLRFGKVEKKKGQKLTAEQNVAKKKKQGVDLDLYSSHDVRKRARRERFWRKGTGGREDYNVWGKQNKHREGYVIKTGGGLNGGGTKEPRIGNKSRERVYERANR